MRALGIDPGSRVTGWGVVETNGHAFRHVASGTIPLSPASSLGTRLARLHTECVRLVRAWTPAAVVLERAFVARNVQSALRLGEARGAVLAAVAAAGAALVEYAPAEVKLAAVGHGGADKETVGRGVTVRLALVKQPAADAADALALAICHLQHAPLVARLPRAAVATGRARRRAAPGRHTRSRGAAEPSV